MMGDLFPNIDRIKTMDCPIMIAHGEDDEIVPFKHARELLEATPNRQKTVFFSRSKMYHNHMDSAIENELMEAINDFMDYHVSPLANR